MGRLAERLSQIVRLTEAEAGFLELLEGRTEEIKRRRPLVRVGDPMREAFVVQSGWAISYTQFADGTRQIRRVALPGDLIGMPSIALRSHAEDLEALTPVIVSRFDRALFARLFEEHPRLLAIMFMIAQLERVTLGDRLASIGRMSCKARLAYLLVDIWMRLRAIDPAIGRTFEMHLTREQMAEMTGMTQIHASRMWVELESEKLIAHAGHTLTILDPARLIAISGHINRAADLDLSWIPAARGIELGQRADP